jgi:F0F1-type ATP synthase assembly protein I
MGSERRFPGWVRYSGVGLELAGAIGGFALVGYWIDGHYGTRPWGILGGVVIGMVGGMYNLVRESLDAVREARADDASARKDADASTDGRADGDK